MSRSKIYIYLTAFLFFSFGQFYPGCEEFKLNFNEPISLKIEQYIRQMPKEKVDRAIELSACASNCTPRILRVIDEISCKYHLPCDDDQATLEEMIKQTKDEKDAKNRFVHGKQILKKCKTEREEKSEQINNQWMQRNSKMLAELFQIMKKEDINWLYYKPKEVPIMELFLREKKNAPEAIKSPYREFLLLRVGESFAVTFHGFEWCVCKKSTIDDKQGYCIDDYTNLVYLQNKHIDLLTTSFYIDKENFLILEIGKFYYAPSLRSEFKEKDLLIFLLKNIFKKGYLLDLKRNKINFIQVNKGGIYF